MLDGMFEVGARELVQAHFLVDAITSASAGSGAANAQPFTETRYEAGGSYTRELDGPTGSWLNKLRLTGESKYPQIRLHVAVRRRARRGRCRAEERDARREAAASRATPSPTPARTRPDGRSAAALRRDLAGHEQGVRVDWYARLLVRGEPDLSSKTIIVAATYDIERLDGFQSNAYRQVVTASGLVPETHPNERLRQAIAVSGRFYVPASQTTFIGAYRYYRDDWQIRAHTPELRIVQEVGKDADASIRYRYYTQTASFFYATRYPAVDPN